MHTVMASLSLVVAWALMRSWQTAIEQGSQVTTVIITSMLLSIAGYHSGVYLVETPRETVDVGFHGANGYREAARHVLSEVPAGATIGANQSGALAFYSHNRNKVVNLDGVVDRFAYRGRRQRDLADYAHHRGLDYYSDWKICLDAFVKYSNQANHSPDFVPIASAPSQGPDQFHVYRIEW